MRRGTLLIAGQNPLAFRAAGTSFTSATVTKPAGVAAGDLVFVVLRTSITPRTLSTASGSAWTDHGTLNLGSDYAQVFSKILDATDVANAWSLSASAEGVAVAYAAPDIASRTLKSTQTASGSASVALTGYVPVANSRGAVTLLVAVDGTAPVTAPSGFTARVEATEGTIKLAAADHAEYTSGSVTWTNMVGSASGSVLAWLFEVVGA